MDNMIIIDDNDTLETEGYANNSLYPYPMPDEVDIREEPLTIFEWMRKLKHGSLIVDPEFQRKLVWKLEQKATFIESILLNIPLPPLYVNQNIKGNYIIVDGLQRTSTLDEFINKNGFKLTGLEVLKGLNDSTFAELDSAYQTKIEDKKFLIYVIKPTVPLVMVYDIFHRINTGGTQLTRQEIRNCIFLGPATRFLKRLAETDYFRQAIDNGISPKRMKDREAVLRYLAFQLFDYRTEYKNDMDAFLEQALKTINTMSDEKLERLSKGFERVMRLSYQFFKEKNFRWPTENSRGRVNIALLESVSYFFSRQDDVFLKANKKRIKKNYQHLLQNQEFADAVRLSTGDIKRVKTRFKLAQQILGEV
ncbi:DUF262 domain-containing protein [Anaerolineales bacterium HSG25]|nr:DUF262 domain-containing protein [Anaerolineales bacterium HSG25]